MISKEELNNFYDKIKSLIKEEMNRWVNLDMHKDEWDPVTIWTHSSVNKILYDEFLLLSKDEKWSNFSANDLTSSTLAMLIGLTEATNLYEDDCVFTKEMLSISLTEKLIFEIKNGMIEYKLSLS